MSKFLVQSASKAQTKRGKTYLRMRLFDEAGRSWPAVMWEDKDVPAGVMIDALVEQEDYNNEKQLNVKALRVLDEKSSDAFLPRSARPPNEMLTELRGFIAQVTHPGLRVLLTGAVEHPGWQRAPAAKVIHHAYLGGLLEHAVNLCRLAHAVAALYPIIRRDLLITAAILHDVGKLEELTCGTNIEYTDEGELLGHIIIGLQMVERLMDRQTDEALPSGLRRLVRHLIISHHGAVSYGSAKPPQLIEAQIFSNLDGIDANMGSMLAAVGKVAGDKRWTERTSTNARLFLDQPCPLGNASQLRAAAGAENTTEHL